MAASISRRSSAERFRFRFMMFASLALALLLALLLLLLAFWLFGFLAFWLFEEREIRNFEISEASKKKLSFNSTMRERMKRMKRVKRVKRMKTSPAEALRKLGLTTVRPLKKFDEVWANLPPPTMLNAKYTAKFAKNKRKFIEDLESVTDSWSKEKIVNIAECRLYTLSERQYKHAARRHFAEESPLRERLPSVALVLISRYLF